MMLLKSPDDSRSPSDLSMDKALKQRLVGAIVLIILAVIVLPMLLSGRSDTFNAGPGRIEFPTQPAELTFETRRFPVVVPDQATVPAARDKAETNSGNVPALKPEPVAKEALPVVKISNKTSQPVEAPADVKVSGQDLPRYLVQVASFSSEKRANALAAELQASKMPVVMDVVDRIAGRLHRVRVGPYVGRSEADAVIKHVRSMNKELRPRIVDTRPGDGAPVSAPSDPLVRWVIQVGSYKSSATAESEVARLRVLGLPAFSEKVSSADNTAYKVRIGPEIDRAKAVQMVKDIKAKYAIDGFVTTQQ